MHPQDAGAFQKIPLFKCTHSKKAHVPMYAMER